MNKTVIQTTLLATFILMLISCSSDSDKATQENVPLEAEVQMNVSYGDNPQQSYDLYLPANRSETKTKTIILVHGGGWIEGDKADMDGFVTLLQQNHPDHAIVNMNYVLATSQTPAFPNQFLDIDRVVNKLTAEKELLQLQADFGLLGVSAGAHLSLQYDYVYDTDDQVKMVVDIVGPTDFTDPRYADDPNFQAALAFFVDEEAYPNSTDYAAATSPALQVNRNSSPTILFYGSEDPLVPLTNGQTLENALSENDITNSFTVYNAAHGDFSRADGLDLQNKVSTFINTHLAID